MAGPDRLARSLRSPILHSVHAPWAARRPRGSLPTSQAFDVDALAANGNLILGHLAPAAPMPYGVAAAFRLVRAGEALVRPAGRPLVGERIGDAPRRPGSIPWAGPPWAYRHALASGTPSHEAPHVSFGDQAPALFGSLLLPLGRDGLATQPIVAALFFEAAQDSAEACP